MQSKTTRGVRHLLVSTGVISLVLSVAAPAALADADESKRGNDKAKGKDAEVEGTEEPAADRKIWVCHLTSSDENRWELNHVSVTAEGPAGEKLPFPDQDALADLTNKNELLAALDDEIGGEALDALVQAGCDLVNGDGVGSGAGEGTDVGSGSNAGGNSDGAGGNTDGSNAGGNSDGAGGNSDGAGGNTDGSNAGGNSDGAGGNTDGSNAGGNSDGAGGNSDGAGGNTGGSNAGGNSDGAGGNTGGSNAGGNSDGAGGNTDGSNAGGNSDNAGGNTDGSNAGGNSDNAGGNGDNGVGEGTGGGKTGNNGVGEGGGGGVSVDTPIETAVPGTGKPVVVVAPEVVEVPVTNAPAPPAAPAHPIPPAQPRSVINISTDSVTKPAAAPQVQQNEVLGAVTTRTPTPGVGALDPGTHAAASITALAATGADGTKVLAVAGVILLLSGFGLQVSGRRRMRSAVVA